jgi:hypothetical protein
MVNSDNGQIIPEIFRAWLRSINGRLPSTCEEVVAVDSSNLMDMPEGISSILTGADCYQENGHLYGEPTLGA